MPSYQVQAIHEAVRAVEFLAASRALAAFGEISAATGVKGAALTRVLASLKAAGWVEEPASRRYELAARVGKLAARAIEANLLRTAEQMGRALRELEHAMEKR